VSGRAAAVLACVLAATTPALADDVALPKTKAVLHVPARWRRVDTTDLVAAYKHDDGSVLAVTRAQVPNPDAWIAKKKAAYADQVERGALRGLKRTAKKLGETNGIPALDLEARRDDGSALVLRILLYRTYALSVAIEVPKGVSLQDARTIATAFGPPPEKPDKK
jgi:hypothetical protein